MIGVVVLAVFTTACMVGFVAGLALIRTFWQPEAEPGMPADLRYHVFDQDGEL